MKTRDTIVNLAYKCLGMNEKDGTHKTIIDGYNSYKPLPRGYKVKYTDAWCATFVSYLAITLGYTDIIPVECSCEEMRKLAVKMGIWCETDSIVPMPGDICIYSWKDDGKGDCTTYPAHVGVVVSVNDTFFTVIEGNKVNAVGKRNVNINGKFIRGFICPDYDNAPVYYPACKYSGVSIVDGLKSVGESDTSKAHRCEIALVNGIMNYTGTAEENHVLLGLLKKGILRKSA